MKLYKFVSLPVDTAVDSLRFRKLVDSLVERRIYLTAMPWLNDPFDGTIILNGLSDTGLQKVQESKKETLKFINQSVTDAYLKKSPPNMLITNRILVASFASESVFQNTTLSDTNGNVVSVRYSDLMWAYYASGHSGVCLEYDFDNIEEITKSIQSDEYGFLKVLYTDTDNVAIGHYPCNPHPALNQVIYSPEPSSIILQDDKCIETYTLFSLFSQKSNSWSFEQEYRLLVAAPEDAAFSLRNTYFVRCNKDCLKSIRLGFKMSVQLKDKLLSELSTEDIAIYDTYLDTNFTLRDKRLK